MASTGTPTPYAGLNQWAEMDKPRMEDFNRDNLKVDEALAGLAEGKADKKKPQIHQLQLTEDFISGTHAEYWKSQEGIVTVSFAITVKGSNMSMPTHKTVAILPEGFRPSKTMQFPITFYNGTMSAGHGNVQANGLITAWSGNFSARSFFGNYSFPV